jgi:citrate lyase subunit beta / citryl-CoA lyase
MELPRTYLFVPGDRPDRYAKALASGADAVVFDLEDAVLPNAKAGARAAVAAFLGTTTQASRAVVRVNANGTPWFAEDLAALAGHPGVAVMLPKAETPRDVAAVRSHCRGATVLALVESAVGVLGAEGLAAAPGVQRLVFGTLDYALDMGLEGNLAATLGLDHAASRVALASRAAGIAPPVAGVTTAIDDETVLLADLLRVRAHGFTAKLCIHPRQVAAIHAALAPTAEEIDWARRVLRAIDEAGSGQGAVQLDGRMLDKPVIERARRVVARAAR